MREFFREIFMGNGGRSMIETFMLTRRLKDAISELSDLQQYRPGEDEAQIAEQSEREIEQAVRDIAVALTGREIKFGKKVGRDKPGPKRMGVRTHHGTDDSKISFFCDECSSEVPYFSEFALAHKDERTCPYCHRGWGNINHTQCHKCKQHYVIFDQNGHMRTSDLTVVAIDPTNSTMLEIFTGDFPKKECG